MVAEYTMGSCLGLWNALVCDFPGMSRGLGTGNATMELKSEKLLRSKPNSFIGRLIDRASLHCP